MSTPTAPRRRPGRGRSASKRRAILDAARETFLRQGYAGTAMDEIAAVAGVSKQTVYAHFTDKSGLFQELIHSDIAHSAGATHPLVTTMATSEDPENDLRRFARVHIADVLQPHLLRLRRMLMAEAERFPALVAAWYASGPAGSVAVFADWFSSWHRRGLLHAPDAHLAAEHFNWLVLSIPLNKAMSLPLNDGSDPPFTPEELDHYADEGVRVFLAAYGVHILATQEGG